MKIKINKEFIDKLKEKVNRKIKNKKFIISIIIISFLAVSYITLNYNDVFYVFGSNGFKSKKIYNISSIKKLERGENDVNIQNMQIVLGGDAAGIKLLATGVLIVGMDRQDTNLEVGDIILKVNKQKVESNTQLLEFAKKSNGEKLDLEVSRNSEIFNIQITPIIDEISKEYKLGLWVKDSSAGVGTITFYEKNSNKFVALGHGVTETKENYILPINSGGITLTEIYSIRKGVAKLPGELKGTITNEIIGDIVLNNDIGIYGRMLDNKCVKNKETIEVMNKKDIKEGKAYIYCTLDDNKVNAYEAEIEKVLLSSEDTKNIIIKITDKRLIEKTGGIVQGMSGSPIVQENKLVGAVTHVFLNDPTKGYGVFAEYMINQMSQIE